MKQSEFSRWLKKMGVEIKKGKKHYKLYYNGKQSTMPRHLSKEIPEGTKQAILRQLGL